MRLSVASLRRVVKGDLAMQFVPQQLTSYSGLELLRRYAQRLGLVGRLRAALAGLSSDYGNARLGLMLLALLFVGGRRLEHLQHVAQDPLVTRFCGLARLPTSRTVANWLKQFRHDTLAPLVALNQALVTETLARLQLPRLTIDVDGSVIRTGMKVGWAFRGFNPHHRKSPSYYPLLAHIAQTGHIVRLKNRPGNVHDSKQAVPFLGELIKDLRHHLGRRVVLEFRMDAAFFQRAIFRLLAARGCRYAVKVGYWSWLPLKRLAAACPHWEPVARGVTGHATVLHVPQWNLTLNVASRCSASTSVTRRAGTSSSISSPLTTGTTNIPRSRATWVSASRRCGPLPAGAGRRRRRSPNSKASSPWTWCPRTITRPTVRGSNSVSSPTTSGAASSGTRSRTPSPPRASGRMRSSSAACARCGSLSWRGQAI
jgi:Transposase DDE domain group 1